MQKSFGIRTIVTILLLCALFLVHVYNPSHYELIIKLIIIFSVGVGLFSDYYIDKRLHRKEGGARQSFWWRVMVLLLMGVFAALTLVHVDLPYYDAIIALVGLSAIVVVIAGSRIDRKYK